MLSDFAEKKKTFLTIKIKTEYFKVPKIAFYFSNGPNPCFWPKMPFFFFIRFDQNNTSNNAF